MYKEILKKYINDDNLTENIVWKNMIKKDGNKGKIPEKDITYSIPCSFDIETSTINLSNDVDNPIFRTNMYIWQFAIGFYPENYDVIIGRTWEEFDTLLKEIAELTAYETKGGTQHHSFRIYVHNLSYEWQFIRKRIEWYKMRGKSKSDGVDVFLIDARKPIKARTKTNIIFLDSYIMSGKSLSDVGKSLLKYKVEKMSGDLDYSLVRNSKTKLTEEEMKYCVNDVLVVIAYIREELEATRKQNTITQLPLTNTGRVRTPLKDASFDDDEWRQHLKDYGEMKPKLYEILSKSFSGGYTHSNPSLCEKKLEDVASMDFTSSYPSVMLSEKYPYGEPSYYELQTFYVVKNLIKLNKPFVAHFQIRGCKLKLTAPDGIIPSSKCENVSDDTGIINGKIIDSEGFDIYGNDIDIKNWLLFYDIEDIIALEMFVYPTYKALPKMLQYKICKMYEKKTTLKGVEGQEREYLRIKGMLNSIYGMSVTRIMRENLIYDGENYDKNILEKEDKLEILNKYSNQVDRPTEYAWGIWITSYARANLFNGILAIGDDYIYSDTDSIKLLNYEKHKDYFEEYNTKIVEKLKNNCKFYYLLNPKDIKGKEHQLGVWDYEEHYKYFKALRAKAYMYTTDDGELHLTLAGCGKIKGTEYFNSFEEPYDEFNLFCKIPSENTGKLIPVDEDNEQTWEVIDYQGNREIVTEKSFRTLKPVPYEMNEETNRAFINSLIAFIKDREAIV